MRCSIVSSSELSCRTPEVVLHEKVFDDLIAYQPNPVQLRVYLGEGSDVLHNRNTTTIRHSFQLFANPTVSKWDPNVQSFKIFDGDEFIRISVR